MKNHIQEAKAEDWLPGLETDSVQLLILDPPYFKVANEKWDHAWKTPADYLDWLGSLADEWRRVLAPNGSLYCFASPAMAARVEVSVIAKRFDVLNSITWPKPDSINKRAKREAQRAYLCQSEQIIFAEQQGSDLEAAGVAGYVSSCEALKRRIFGDYLRAEVDRAGAARKEIVALFPSASGNPTGCVSNWLIGYNCPTPEQWGAIRSYLNRDQGEYLRREYEDLRREYEDLRREYEDLRRPFQVSANVPHTDVWIYPTVTPQPGRHPCEKPLPMLRDMIRASSRPGDLVVDCFAGSGSTCAAAIDTGRQFAGCDADPKWVARGNERAEKHLSVKEKRPIMAPAKPRKLISGPLIDMLG